MTNMRHKHLLKSETDEFRSLIAKTSATKTDIEFFRIVTQEIVPLIRKADVFVVHKSKWNQARILHLQEIDRLNLRIPTEIEQAFESLKLKIPEGELLHNPYINLKICSIEEAFQQKEGHGGAGYSYIDFVYEQTKQLLGILLAHEINGICEDYGNVKLSHMPMINVFTGQLKMNSKFINKFTFAPSLTKKRELEGLFQNSTKVTESWIAWELLLHSEWCWNTQESFFDIGETSPVPYNHWAEVNGIKNCNVELENISDRFFSREKFGACLNLIYGEIVPRELENVQAETALDIKLPYFIELRLLSCYMGYYLLLDISWNIIEECDTRIIHCFRNETPDCKLIDRLLSTDCGTIVHIDEMDGQSVARSFKRMKLDNVIGNIFFEKSDNRTRCISMQAKKIMTADIAKSDAVKLAKHILNLKSYKLLF